VQFTQHQPQAPQPGLKFPELTDEKQSKGPFTQLQPQEQPPDQHPKPQNPQQHPQEQQQRGQNSGVGDSDGENLQQKVTPKPHFDSSHVQREKDVQPEVC